MRAGVKPHFTIVNAIFDCGVTDDALFNGDTKSDKMATGLFNDDFLSCMDKNYKEIDKNLRL